MSITAVSARRETHVIGLISMAHMLSHLYMLALPPLFPLMRADLGLSYAQLGLAITCFAVATGLLQTPMGFVCERIGARLYNLAHTYTVPALLFALGWLGGAGWLVSVALIWAAHIGLDRALGYGLKYPGRFRDTHLGTMGKHKDVPFADAR